MPKLLLAALAAGLIIVLSGILLSMILGDTSKALAAKFTFQMSGGARFIYHVGLRLFIGAALTALIYFASPAEAGLNRLLITITAAWFLSYVPGFLFLGDLGVLPLSKAGIIIIWGWGEFAAAGLIAHRIIS